MSGIFFVLRSSFADFKRSKMKTFLTSLGILIGVFAVVTLTALGLGLKKYISDQFEALGRNTLFIIPGQVLQGGSFSASSFLGGNFDIKDLTGLSRIRDIKSIAPISTKSGDVKSHKKTEYVTIFFSSADFKDITGLNVSKGRFFNKSDVGKKAKVLVAGKTIAEKLFGTPDQAVGQRVSIDNINFEIIGILKSTGGGGFGGSDYDAYMFGPYTTGYVFDPGKKFIRFAIKYNENANVNVVKEEINKVMLRRYKSDDYSLIEPSQLMSAINSIFAVINIVLVALASISLLVGGIGIMNIMYVTVSDKTKEVGIRRALGARKNDILIQFLIESVILSVIGGVLGLVLAYLGVLAVQSVFPAYVDVGSVILALGVSSGIGILFGVFPAKKASDLTPVEAIRYE